jgi:hypothetical protein
MIPLDPGGGGYRSNKMKPPRAKPSTHEPKQDYFKVEFHREADAKVGSSPEIFRRVGNVVAQANSRFLHSAVPFGFAQGPAPVGMTRS